ncbi:hypothetical protein Tco_0145922, partial [Tanacetum coccineum]
FGKCFVAQKELSAEQAFWLKFSNPISEQPDVQTTPVRMEAPSELLKCYVDKKKFDIQKKEIFLDHDRLLEHIICQDVMNIVMHADSIPVNVLSANNKFHIYVNSLATITNYAKMKQDYIDEYSENLVLKAELAKKEQMVEKKIFDKVEKNVVEKDATQNKAKVIALRMFKLDLEPLAPIVLKNRDTHIDYIKHSQEHADTLREIVKHARALIPLDNDLDSTYKYVQRIQEMLVYVTTTCPSLSKPSEKLVAVTPLNKNKKVRWKPTGWTFTIVGNTFLLTRITSTKVEPLKVNTSKSVTTLNLEIKIYRRKTQVAKLVDLSSKPSILGSRPTNISKPNKHWGSTISKSPSSSLVNFKLSKLFSSIWTPDAPSI